MEEDDDELLRKANEIIKNVTPEQIREAQKQKEDFDQMTDLFFHYVSNALHKLIAQKTNNAEILNIFPIDNVMCFQEKFYNGVNDDIAFITIEPVTNAYNFENEVEKLEKYYINDFKMPKDEFMKLTKKQQLEGCVSKIRFYYERLINFVLMFYKKHYFNNQDLFKNENLSTLYFDRENNTIYFNKTDDIVLGIKIYLKSNNDLPNLQYYN